MVSPQHLGCGGEAAVPEFPQRRCDRAGGRGYHLADVVLEPGCGLGCGWGGGLRGRRSIDGGGDGHGALSEAAVEA
jgi:hypothetical protein